MAEQRASADDLARHPKHPVARVVECRGVFWRACHMRLHNLKDEEIVTKAPSCSRHSKLAWHSEMRGAATESASLRVRPNSENLSTFVPDVLHFCSYCAKSGSTRVVTNLLFPSSGSLSLPWIKRLEIPISATLPSFRSCSNWL